jgi:hypothetical protein
MTLLSLGFLVAGPTPGLAYPDIVLENKTPFTITKWGVKYLSAACKDDSETKLERIDPPFKYKKIPFGPGETWKKSRGVCLVTKIWAKIKGKKGYVKSYKSSGTSFSKFVVLGGKKDEVRIYSQSEIDRRKAGASCGPFMPCGTGLNCDATTFTCKKPGKLLQSCHATRPCKAPLQCAPGLFQCLPPHRLDWSNKKTCLKLFDTDLASRLRGKFKQTWPKLPYQPSTRSWGNGATMQLGYARVRETGVVFEPSTGNFGCYKTECHGGATEAAGIAAFATWGRYDHWRDFAGKSQVLEVGASAPVFEVGAAGGSVHRIGPDGRRPKIGDYTAVSLGLGFSPMSNSFSECETELNQVRFEKD